MKSRDPKIDRIDELARQYHKTQNEQLKSLWYKAVKQWLIQGGNMRLRDLQQILDKFTDGQKGTTISDCHVYIETQDGHLEDLRRMEIQESMIINDPNRQRLVLKHDNEKQFGKSLTFNKT